MPEMKTLNGYEIVAKGAVRYDQAQTLTAAQQEQARKNIGAVSTVNGQKPNESGDVTVTAKAEQPSFVDSIEEMTDTSKAYVLKTDGYIYTYTKKYVFKEHNANDGTGYLNANASGTWGDNRVEVAGTTTGMWSSPLIHIDTSVISPVGNPEGSRCVISGLEKLVKRYYSTVRVHYYSADGTQKYSLTGASFPEIGDVEETALPVTFNLKTTTTFNDALWANICAVRVVLGISASNISADDVASLKVNIPALNTNEEVTGWFSTGVSYVQSDNSAAIEKLQSDVDNLMEAVGNISGKSDTTWYAIGDSITAGYGVGLENAWYTHVKRINGYADNSLNLGVSSIGFVRVDLNYGKTIRSIVNENNFANGNLVTVAVGINDWTEQLSMDDVKTEMRYCFQKILTDNPYCKIIFIAPFNTAKKGTIDTNWAMGYSVGDRTLKQFIDEQKSVCEEYGVQVIDLSNCGVINRYNIQSVLYDNLHPDADCHNALGKELARRITFA